jgi:Lrp/AsnC family leucine-responsive transcriptional regulator
MGKLDTVDIKILKELQKNSKLSTKELAEKVNLSSTPTFETSEAFGT